MRYSSSLGLAGGAFVLALGVLFFLVNVVKTARGPRTAPIDPWDARTIEWMTTSPPKAHNFGAIPYVQSLDEFWYRKYEESETTGRLEQIATAEDVIGELERHRDAEDRGLLAAARHPEAEPALGVGA